MRGNAGANASAPTDDRNFRRGSFIVRPRNAQNISIAFRSIGTEEPSIATKKKTRAASFDHIVGKGEKCRRNSEAQTLGGFEVDDKGELSWLLHRNIAGLRAVK